MNKKLKKINNENKLYNYALYWLYKYPCSEKKLSDRLQKKCDDKDLINKIINKLKEIGYINDKNLFKSLCQKNYGIKKIKQKCIQKGINIDENDIKYIELNEVNTLNNYLSKIINKYNLKDLKSKQKLLRHLLNKGFTYKNIKKTLFLNLKDLNENSNNT